MINARWGVIGILKAAILSMAMSANAGMPSEASEELLKQYTSRGHVLGFDSGGYYVSNGTYALRVRFEDAAAVAPSSDDAAQDPSGQWRAAPLARVTYADVWPGISVTYDAPASGIARSTWTLEPGADAARIRLRYNRPVQLGDAGELGIAFETGAMTESRPVAWQDVDGQRQWVEVAFVQRDDARVGFQVGAYRRDLPLIIDPTLSWNTFLGSDGSEYDAGNAIAVDSGGNVYVAGNSNGSWGSPVRAFSTGNDVFAAKLSAAGALTWNTFLGGSGTDRGHAIAVDSGGNVYVAGYSDATWGSPVGAFSGSDDAFAAKLSAAGALTWNTFLGGGGTDYGHAIAVDSGGNVYVVGKSGPWGSPVRAYSGGGDAFAARLSAGGALTWNTFLGGSGSDLGNAIAVDGSGNVYVAGYSGATWGSPVGAFSGSDDAFAAKLSAAGALTWNTFLGGSGTDRGDAIAVDSGGNVYVAGNSSLTWGTPARAFSGGSSDAFAAKLSAAGVLTWNTFLGGSADDYGYDIAVDGGGNVHVAGYSNATWGSPVRAFSGGSSADAFAAKLSTAGALTWNTFLGGGSGNSDYGLDIAIDGSGNVYVAGYSVATWGSPVRAHSGFADAFAAKVSAAGALTWNTFLGGNGIDQGRAIAVDGSGNVYVAGYSGATWGSPVRAFSGSDDAFAAKLSAGGVLTWNTFLGGSSEDYGNAIAVDVSGNIYVAGNSGATWGSPVGGHSGFDDAFAAKLSPAGALTWNTFLGGSGNDLGKAIAVDGSGNVYVAGGGVGWGSPVRAYSAGGDAFAAKLSAAGALTWNTFLGGSGYDLGNAIAVDGSGNVYVAGRGDATWGSPVRAFSTGNDVFAAKLSAAGALTWNTFLGGSGNDLGNAIAVDGSGNVYVAGDSDATWDSPVRAYSGGLEGFAAKLSAAGALTWNTFLGGSSGGGFDRGTAIAVDGSANIYVAGYSTGTWGSPVGAFSVGPDAFAAKLSGAGALTWHTFVGGSSSEHALSIAVDGSGNVYVGGESAATWGSPVRAFGASWDAFAAMIASDAVCGNASVEAGEQCDDGNTANGDCCSSSCQYEANGAPCASDGLPCSTDVCDATGTCTHRPSPSGTECSAAAGACDVAETCDGSSTSCPADAFASSGMCRPAADVCDAPESCDGSGANCPADGYLSSGVCRAPAGACDAAESCDGAGAACPPDQKSSGVCRAAAGVCDVAESCDGVSNTCPSDVKSTSVCRAAAGICDVAELCDGVSDTCSSDALLGAGTTCRSASGECDLAETCSGSNPACPADAAKPNGTACSSDGDPCTADACDGAGLCVHGDGDADGIGDLCDNCADDENPDQSNADCPDPAFFPGGCATTPPANRAGCCDGGDVCDACPAQRNNTQCDAQATAGASVGSAGGSLSTPDGSVSILVPPGALSSPTSITVTDNGPATFNLGSVVSISARPEGQTFAQPVRFTFSWADRDNDGRVDLGTCQTSGPDLDLSCDADADCSSGACSVRSGPAESSLVLKRNGNRFSKGGFSAPPYRCSDHLTGCAGMVADCTDAPGTGTATVANCCDPAANTWSFQTCSFSEFLLALPPADLIPGKGSPTTDCQAQWSVLNPLNVPYLDKKGVPNFKQSCADGDPTCDLDQSANGICVFEVAACFGTDDPRLGEGVCTPAPTDAWLLKKPKLDSTKPGEAINAVALRDSVALTGGLLGPDPAQVLFAPALPTDSCSESALVSVPLRGPTKDGKATLKMQTLAGTVNDSDKLQLICRPAGS